MTWDGVLDVLGWACVLGGAFLSLAAGVGAVRFPDLLARMHAATKPQVLGVLLMMLGLALRLRNGPIIWMLVLVALFQLLTAPVSAHMVARAGYRTGKVRHDLLVVDELTRDLDAVRERILAEAGSVEAASAEAADAVPPEEAEEPRTEQSKEVRGSADPGSSRSGEPADES